MSTLHVLGLPHTQTTSEYATCAYTQRIIKFCRMMTGGERPVILYSGEFNDAPCDEHVPLLSEERRQSWFGPHDESDLGRGGFKWEADEPLAYWGEINAASVREIRERWNEQDILCITAGAAQKTVADCFSTTIGAEIMVGYRGILHGPRLSPVYAAFESQSHRAMVYGEQGWQTCPRAGDVVIPNQFDPDELPYGDGGDYLLFVGRLIQYKGIESACRVADVLGMRLVVAGPGMDEFGPGYLRNVEGDEWRCERLEYVGTVGIEERAELMGGAACLMVPTWYAEPFGGVAVEAMMCGTPVASTDFGAFTDTVRPGISGYRFSTLQEAVDGTEAAMRLDREAVRNYAIENYSMEAVRPMYEHWFDNLDTLWGDGFATLRETVA